MSKLLTTLLAAVFAAVTVTPVAFAQDTTKEPKKTMKKGADTKKTQTKKGEPKSQPKKTMKKGADTKKEK